MISELTKPIRPDAVLDFPSLGVGKRGVVVLFSAPGVGTVVHSDGYQESPLGKHYQSWDMSSFVALTDTQRVVLTN